jgi:hypothetical protein
LRQPQKGAGGERDEAGTWNLVINYFETVAKRQIKNGEAKHLMLVFMS